MREDPAIPTSALEIIILTSIFDAKEELNVMSADVPNAYIQTKIPDIEDGKERVIMKITGVIVNLLVKMAP